MQPFIHDDFLLATPTARRLYHTFAAGQPIIDYHSHLPPQDIAADRRFANLFEIWLEGDHYKWRAMRAAGVSEEFCTGAATPKDKFLAYARTVPQTLRNPLYHWSHLELSRYFGFDKLLDESTAEEVWERANARLAEDDMTARAIMKRFDVRVQCTTDDPADSLQHHRAIAESDCSTRVYPTFRPDKALGVHDASRFNEWVDRLAATAEVDIVRLPDLLDALDRRHQAFHDVGGRLSDHGLETCFADFRGADEAARIFDAVRGGKSASPEERERFGGHLMLFFGRLDAQRGWTKQLHLGSLRNNSTRVFKQVGADAGCDSIGDWSQAQRLSAYLDRLEQEGALPRMVLYNNNPVDNYVFATMAGNFQDGSTPGKIQFGGGWWYLDQKEGIEWQLNALSNLGLLSQFVGMLTDSRSFMSFPRHEYFRRVLCNLIGREIELGEIPDEESLFGPLIENICFGNAARFLGLGTPKGKEG